MLEYSLDDAELLLTKNHNAALRSLEVVENDLGFLRDQTTTIEVSILFDVTTTSEAIKRTWRDLLSERTVKLVN